MILGSVFHDECHDYLSKLEPDIGDGIEVKLRIEKGKAKSVYLVEDGIEYLMEKRYEDESFDYYIYNKVLKQDVFKYSFRIECENEVVYYSKMGVSYRENPDYEFRVFPGFKTPDWAKGCIMYQIFIDRFNRSDDGVHVNNDEYIYIGRPVKYVEKWDEKVENFDVHRFYGGNLQGVWDKLEYLKSIGVEAIYFNPLFVSPSNHKYDAQDYNYIDPHLTVLKSSTEKSVLSDGNDKALSYIERTAKAENLEASNKFFADFVAYAHSLNIKIILDGVFNHCGSFHRWLDREKIYSNANALYGEQYPTGAFLSKESPYREYFGFEKDSMSYEGWWGHDTLPKLNYENSEKLLEEVVSVAKKWLQEPYCVDGWRLDVAADLAHSEEFNHYFWKRFREEVKSVNKDALILAEHYGDPSAWLDGKQWDTVMNYDGFMEPVTWFLTGLEKHSDREEKNLCGDGEAFLAMIRHSSSKMPMPALLVAMNELSNHDHSRFLTRTNKKVGRLSTLGHEAASEGVNHAILRQAIMMQMSLQGAPTIYYGDEAGVCGFTDPDSRRTYPWGKEDNGILMFYRYLALIHKQNICLKLGSFIPIIMEKNLVVYSRTYKDNKALVLVYTGKEQKKVNIPIYIGGIQKGDTMSRLMYSDENGHNAGKIDIVLDKNFLEIELKADTSILYIVEGEA